MPLESERRRKRRDSWIAFRLKYKCIIRVFIQKIFRSISSCQSVGKIFGLLYEMGSSEDEEYFMDVNTFMETREKARKEGFRHFSHEHLLALKELSDLTATDVNNNHYPCNVCGLAIRGYAYYTCSTMNCVFNLHEFCAFLPEYITHFPGHNTHYKLGLKYYDVDEPKYCDLCSSMINDMISYYCLEPDCDFDSDLRCVAFKLAVKDPDHPHTLAPWLYPASFVCSICGERDDEESLSYLCRECSFWIHDRCYPLPRTIKHATHPHSLQISPQKCRVWPASFANCGVCQKEMMKANNWFYSCSLCNYFIHIQCSRIGIEIELPQLNPEELKSLIKLPISDRESVHQTITQLVKKLCKPEEEKESSSLEMLRHQHLLGQECPLMICETDINKGNNHVCDACVLPISDLPHYICLGNSCKFFLHKWCANLPKELQFPHHPEHRLILVEKKTDKFEFYECKICRKMVNGFVFKCGECEDYYVDVKCAALPRFLHHETHEHPLRLVKGEDDVRCYCCGYVIKFYSDSECCLAYGCVACHVYLHVSCIWLPQEIKHRYDKHPYSLLYNPPVSIAEDGSVYEYYCEFCEAETFTGEWFYHCIECDRSAHIICISEDIKLYTGVKYGGSYQSKFHPEYPLTCVYEMEKSCIVCGYQYAFECYICKSSSRTPTHMG